MQTTSGRLKRLMECAVDFRGTRERISMVEKEVYDPREDAFFRRKSIGGQSVLHDEGEEMLSNYPYARAKWGAGGGSATD